MKILIVKLGALGDVINTLPLAVALKGGMPGCTIDWLVAPLSYPLVSRHTSVDRAYVFNRTFKSAFSVIKELRRTRYDIILDLQRILKSGLFTLAARAERRLGFDKRRCKEMTWLLPFERIPPSDPAAHMLDQYMEFARYLGLNTDRAVWDIPRSVTRPKDIPNRYVVLNIGATKPANLWAPERFADLAGQIEKTLNLPSVLTGGPEDRDRATQIKAAGPVSLTDLTGRTTLAELVEVIANADAVVSCDTGPMHLAAALEKPLVALFGPSDPRRTGPYHGTVIRHAMACSPCNRKLCRAPFCMDAITSTEVSQELCRLI